MIYLTGDTHADFIRFGTTMFPEQKEMSRNDLVIVLGDFGGIWHDTPSERYWLNWLAEKPFTICYVDGNHENFDRYYYSDEFEVVDFHGGKAHKIRDNIYHLMRGYIFDFEGKKFFCMGGARSHDISDGILNPSDFSSHKELIQKCRLMDRQRKMYRINHLSWWKEELPDQYEMDFGEQTLSDAGYHVDYVLSHCLPQKMVCIAGYQNDDSLTKYFDKLLENGLEFESWWCGHYHENTCIEDRFHILYEDIVRLL